MQPPREKQTDQERHESREPASPPAGAAPPQQASPLPLPGIRPDRTDQEREHVTLADAPVYDECIVPARKDTREVIQDDYQDKVHESYIPHLHVKEAFEEVVHTRNKKRFLNEPAMEVYHRKLSVPKPVMREETVAVPQLHVIDRVVEKTVDVEKTRTVRRPRYIIQERLVPVPKRTIEETNVRVPKAEWQRIVEDRLDVAKFPGPQLSDLQYDVATGEWYPGMAGETIPDILRDQSGVLDGEHAEFRDPNAPNAAGPKYRQVPRPVEIPIIHYKPNPVERIVDRHVPIPVELRVTQEYHVPKIVPVWKDVPMPIYVKRRIEKPVPADCFLNKAMLNAYMAATKDIDKAASSLAATGAGQEGVFSSCCNPGAFGHPVRVKMTEAERQAAGLSESDLKHLQTLDSRGWAAPEHINRSDSRAFLASQFTLQPEAQI